MTTCIEGAQRGIPNSQQLAPEDDASREIRELREQIEQAVVCVNTALYVLLKNVERAKH